MLLRTAGRARRQLVLENLALRQQLIAMRRAAKRPPLRNEDRLFWLAMAKRLPRWRECLLIVKPVTVLGWHRKGWRWYWRRKSRHIIGRPAIGWKLVRLIRRLSLENVT